MKTIGYKLTALSPSRGASAELAASLTVVSASYIGLPVSIINQNYLQFTTNLTILTVTPLSYHAGFYNSMYRRCCVRHWMCRRMAECAMDVTCQSLCQLGCCVLHSCCILCWDVLLLLLHSFCHGPCD